jgi:pimeloyl-ACP methyl ester carboxylesterase
LRRPNTQQPRIQPSRTGLFHVRDGQGAPVVFVHGTCGDWRTFEGIRTRVARRFEYISYSRRGHHPGPGDVQCGACTLDAHVRDLVALIDELRTGPVHVVGNSQGGYIALRLLLEHPDAVRSAVVGEPGLVTPLADGDEGATYVAERALKMATVHALVDAGETQSGARLLFDVVTARSGAFDELPQVRQQRWLDNADTLRLQERARAPLSREVLEKALRPVLVVRGARTTPYHRVTTRALLGWLPAGAREAVIPDAGHMSYVDNPDAFAAAVLEFVESR